MKGGFWEEMEAELSKETSGGGTQGAYQDIVDQFGNTIVVGHRRTLARLCSLSLPVIKEKSFLDLGCNIGANLKYLSERGGQCTGVEYNPVFCKWAKKIAPQAAIIQANLSKPISELKDKKFNYVFCFSIWDYIDSNNLIKTIRDVSTKDTVVYFEGHADGEKRISQSIMYEGKELPSWNSVLTSIGFSKVKLIGMMENNTRPLFECGF